MSKRLFIMCTFGPDDHERATVPFAIATAAQAADAEVVMGFQIDAVRIAAKGGVDGVSAAGFPPLKDLIEAYQEAGGAMLVCAPCMLARGIQPDDLISGCTVVGGAVFVEEALKATSTLTY